METLRNPYNSLEHALDLNLNLSRRHVWTAERHLGRVRPAPCLTGHLPARDPLFCGRRFAGLEEEEHPLGVKAKP